MDQQQKIDAFLSSKRFAVVGASADRSKYGNKVLRAYLQHDYDAVPVNPNATTVEGLDVAHNLAAVDPPADAISIITQPHITERVVNEAIELGIKHIWMQPGAESPAAEATAQEAGINLISSGPCLLVVIGYRE